MRAMKRVCEMSWPPPVGEWYIVDDAFGSFEEVIMPGAFDHAGSCDGERTMVVGEDDWNEDFTSRVIRRVGAVSMA